MSLTFDNKGGGGFQSSNVSWCHTTVRFGPIYIEISTFETSRFTVSQLNIKSIRFNAVFQVKSNFRFGPILIDLH